MVTPCPFVFSGKGGTFGGGDGGGLPKRFSNIHAPRVTGDVRLGEEVTMRKLPWPSKPLLVLSSMVTRRLALKRLPEVVIKIRINEQVGIPIFQLAQEQPLICKVVDQCLRARVFQHALHLLLQDSGILQFSLFSGGQKFFVRSI